MSSSRNCVACLYVNKYDSSSVYSWYFETLYSSVSSSTVLAKITFAFPTNDYLLFATSVNYAARFKIDVKIKTHLRNIG